MTDQCSDMASFGFSTVKFKNDDTDSDDDGEKLTQIGLIPKFGFFLADNFALGLDVNLGYGSDKYGDNKSTTTVFAAGPFARYYFPTPKVSPFIELNSSFGQHKSKSDYNGTETENKTNVTSLGGGAGLAFPLGKVVTFDIFAGYSSATFKDPEDNEDNSRLVVGTIGLKFGVVVFLGAKSE